MTTAKRLFTLLSLLISLCSFANREPPTEVFELASEILEQELPGQWRSDLLEKENIKALVMNKLKELGPPKREGQRRGPGIEGESPRGERRPEPKERLSELRPKLKEILTEKEFLQNLKSTINEVTPSEERVVAKTDSATINPDCAAMIKMEESKNTQLEEQIKGLELTVSHSVNKQSSRPKKREAPRSEKPASLSYQREERPQRRERSQRRESGQRSSTRRDSGNESEAFSVDTSAELAYIMNVGGESDSASFSTSMYGNSGFNGMSGYGRR